MHAPALHSKRIEGILRMHLKFSFPLHGVLAARGLGKLRNEGASDKVAFLTLRGWGTRSSFCLSGGLYFLHIQ